MAETKADQNQTFFSQHRFSSDSVLAHSLSVDIADCQLPVAIWGQNIGSDSHVKCVRRYRLLLSLLSFVTNHFPLAQLSVKYHTVGIDR